MWRFYDQPDDVLESDINAGLDRFNLGALGVAPDRSRLKWAAAQYDDKGLLAAITAKTMVSSSYLYVELIYVREDARGRGLGQEMLAMAEKQALALGKTGLTVQTLSFQAPGFYVRCGFNEYAVLENDFAGAARHYFKKQVA